MPIDRYHRQMLLPQIGEAGQAQLADSRILLIGCGALGSNVAEQLARAGVGHLQIADRDIVELTNLQRQVLFDENDAIQGLPKAVAAAQRLSKVNSNIDVNPLVVDVDAGNIEELIGQSDFVIDGTDNIATRYLLNDAAIKLNKPWVYGACVGTEGRVMTVLPNAGPCLRCVFATPPDPRELATCDTAGVLGPVATTVASMQAVAAIKFLTGNRSAIAAELITFDLWTNYFRSVSIAEARRTDCLACGQYQFDFLQKNASQETTKLCGRNAVQVRSRVGRLSLEDAAQCLRTAGKVELLPYLVRCTLDENGISLSAFEDGRIIIQGTNDLGRAKSIAAKYFGD